MGSARYTAPSFNSLPETPSLPEDFEESSFKSSSNTECGSVKGHKQSDTGVVTGEAEAKN